MSVTFETQREKANSITLVIRVSDTGQGMTPEQLDKLFDEYIRFNREINRAVEGAGLGMSITKQLVRLMNGEILVESDPGKGSVFTLRLPQELVAGAGVLGKELVQKIGQLRPGRSAQKKKAPVIHEYMPYGRVLVVDDVETNLYVTRGLLTPYGMSVETAVSGYEVIEKIKIGSTWDIIFMDHFMPGIDGVETAKIIRDMGYTKPIVALTANVITGQAEMFYANGFDDFLSKPIDIRQLNAVLNKLIRDKYTAETIDAARRLKDKMERKSGAKEPQASLNPELANIFIRDAEKAITILETLYEKRGNFEDKDIETYIINTHAVKSALFNVGETNLSAFAGKLEEAGKARQTAVIENETPEFLTALREVINRIKPN
jgi:CheY-like chemotaxis protein